MHIELIKLKHFQAHLDRTITFTPGITTIIGRSDIGKSAILRALRWVCLNDFSGDDFIHWDAEEAKVLIAIVNGFERAKVIRSKTGRSSGNLYKLVVQGKKMAFKSFKSAVPDQIKQVLQMDEINFQEQYDTPFWFKETAGEVSRRLNAIIDLSIIDTALSRVSGIVRTASDHCTFIDANLQASRTTYRELRKQEDRIKEFAQLQKLRTQRAQTKADRSELEEYIQSIGLNQQSITQLKKKAADTSQLFELGRTYRQARSAVKLLSQTILEHQTLSKQCQAPPNFKPVETAFQLAVSTGEEAQALRDLVCRIQQTKDQLYTSQADHFHAEKRFAKETKGKKCPLCEMLLP